MRAWNSPCQTFSCSCSCSAIGGARNRRRVGIEHEHEHEKVKKDGCDSEKWLIDTEQPTRVCLRDVSREVLFDDAVKFSGAFDVGDMGTE